MLPLPARLTREALETDNRGAARRSLRLEVRAASPTDASSALIRNLSEQGLLIETATDLAVGDMIHVDLPEVGISDARVVWRDGSFAGCEFLRPVPRAAVSAALLLAPVEQAPPISLQDPPEPSAFVDDWAEPEYRPAVSSPAIDALMKVSLVVALVVAALFIYALLTAPFAT